MEKWYVTILVNGTKVTFYETYNSSEAEVKKGVMNYIKDLYGDKPKSIVFGRDMETAEVII